MLIVVKSLVSAFPVESSAAEAVDSSKETMTKNQKGRKREAASKRIRDVGHKIKRVFIYG